MFGHAVCKTILMEKKGRSLDGKFLNTNTIKTSNMFLLSKIN